MSDAEFSSGEDQVNLNDLFTVEAEQEEADPIGFLLGLEKEFAALSYLGLFNTMAVRELIRIVTGHEINEETETMSETLELLKNTPSVRSATVQESE